MPPQTPSFVPEGSASLPPLEPASPGGPEGTFTETAKQIFARLNERKYLVLQRALLAIWPTLLTVVLAYVFWGGAVDNRENGFEVIAGSVSANPIEGWVFGAMVVFSIVYGMVAAAVLAIERVIWADSYFDGKNLQPEESLRIARRLLPSAVRFWFWSFARFWLLPFAVFLLVPAASVAGGLLGFVHPGIVVLAIFLTFIGIGVWTFFLNVKLRFLWFLFLDCHDGAQVDTGRVVAELDRLNRETKTKEFAKYVISVAGVGTITGLAAALAKVAAQVSGASGFLNRTAAGQGIKLYGQTVAKQAQSFANIVAAYVFYRAARTRLGIGQEVNERVYALARG